MILELEIGKFTLKQLIQMKYKEKMPFTYHEKCKIIFDLLEIMYEMYINNIIHV